jgi:hypothetical protein
MKFTIRLDNKPTILKIHSSPLNGFQKNIASNIEQNFSNHSFGYAFQNICPIFFTIFSRKSIPFMKYAGLGHK